MGSQVALDPVVNGGGPGAREACDLGDEIASGHQEDGLQAPVGSDIGGSLQGAGQPLSVVLVKAKLIRCSVVGEDGRQWCVE